MWVGPFPRAAKAFEGTMQKFAISSGESLKVASKIKLNWRTARAQSLIDEAMAAKRYDRLETLYKELDKAKELDQAEAEEEARKGMHHLSCMKHALIYSLICSVSCGEVSCVRTEIRKGRREVLQTRHVRGHTGRESLQSTVWGTCSSGV